MFINQVQQVFNAQTALHMAEQKDPRFEQLVARLMERCSLSREQTILKIVELAKGNLNV